MAMKPCAIERFDEHGFAVFSKKDITRPDTERCHDYSVPKLSKKLEKKWAAFLEQWDDSLINEPEQLGLIREGVPSQFRPTLWTNLLEVESLKLCNSFHYRAELENVREQLVELGISEFSGSNAVTQLCDAEEENEYVARPGQISIQALRHILLDLERTYPTHMLFISRDGEGKEGRAALFRVLASYARYNKSVEYCQGMSAIAGMFVMYMSEEDAFWCLVSLLERHKYLVGYFSVDMSRLRKHAEVFEKLLYQRHPDLQRHLDSHNIKPLMYVTPWFLCLYTSLSCWDTVLSIWDLLLFQGYKTLFRVGLAVLEIMKPELLACDSMSQLLPKLLRLPAHAVRHETLVPKIFTTVVEEWEINCLLSIVDEEERVTIEEEEAAANSTNQNGGAASNLGWGTLQWRGQKRKGSESCSTTSGGGVFRFQGRDARPTKRQKFDTTDTPSQPSFLSKIRNMFNRNTDKTEIQSAHRIKSTNHNIRSGNQLHSSPMRRRRSRGVTSSPASRGHVRTRSRRSSGRGVSHQHNGGGTPSQVLPSTAPSLKRIHAVNTAMDCTSSPRRSPRLRSAVRPRPEDTVMPKSFHFGGDTMTSEARRPLAENTNIMKPQTLPVEKMCTSLPTHTSRLRATRSAKRQQMHPN